MKDVWKEEYNPQKRAKKKSRKRIIVTAIVIAIIAVTIIAIGVYCKNEQARNWVDKNVFRKEISQDNVATIDLKEGQDVNVYAFNKYIGILDQTKFTIYSNSGNKEKDLDVQISTPIYSTANRFLAIAEKDGQKVYLITDKDITWNTEVEGNIAQIEVNKNGYVAVVITGTLNKTVIKMFDPSGNAMFTQYLSTTRAIDVTISNDNKYLAIAEVDTSKMTIQSNVKIISIEKAEKNSDDYLEKTYSSTPGKLITNVKYQDKNKLVCMYTDEITVIENEQEKSIVKTENKKMIFQTIDLNNSICYIEEQTSGLFTADSVVNIVNVDTKENKQYVVNYVAKDIYTNTDIIALNLGTEVEFINKGGWLVKRYLANQEITNIVVSNNIAGIVYRDKIEIVNL